MSFKSDDRIRLLIQEALVDSEIQKGIKESGITISVIDEEIQRNVNQIWSSSISEIVEYDLLVAKSKILTEKINPYLAIIKDYKKRPSVLYLTYLSSIFAVIIFAIGTFSLKYGIYIYRIVRKQSLIIEIICALLASANLILVVIFVLILIRVFKKVRFFRNIIKDKGSNFFEEKNREIEELVTITEDLETSEKKINSNILERSIKEIIREKLNTYIKPSYETNLTIIDAPGLAEVIDTSKAVDTKAKNDLDFLLQNMPGGSIGIAGPRGAGKSTLINLYCGKNRVVDQINGRKILPIISSAPVQYVGREFILHLFSLTCQTFLKNEGAEIKPNYFNEKENIQNSERKYILTKIMNRTAPVLNFISVVLITVGFIMINILSNYYPIKESDLPKNLPLSVRYIKLIGVSPGTFLIVGLILFAISFGRIFVRTIERTTREKNVKDDHVNATSIKIASDWIRKIKFQQTFTSGWSGGLKLPIGLEGGINRAYSFAENQLSIPEIVTGFVDFISSIPKEYLIIIGIDEMDKIDSDEHAQAFLNELKSIFGLPRCFFLVSVSENAMSSFERRGLPFRDVFDSSFDHIIYVEYLTLENAKALLQRRVIGKPIPFFCLSYCLSGGLPRDLIRNFREIVKISKSNLVNKDISSVCEQLLKDEYSSKIRAVTFSAKKVQSLREADEFFSILNTLATSSLSSEFVKRSLNTLKSWKVSITPKVETENEIHKSYQILFDLCEELCTYTYFIDTVLQLFTNNFDRDKFDEIYSTHGFERLAQARQALSVDMSVANWVINEMRANYQMEAFHR